MKPPSLSRLGAVASLLFSIALAGCATAPSVSPSARAELAPTGKVRVGLLTYNPLFVTQGTPPGELKGVAVDIGGQLADRLGVPYQGVEYRSIGAVLQGAKTGEWDVAFLAIDPARSGDMDFTPAFMEVQTSYLVPARSPLMTVADVDRAGIRVAAMARSTQNNYLKQNLKHATLLSPEDTAQALKELSAGGVDAVAANRLQLDAYAAKTPGARVLDGSFYNTPLGIAVPKGRPAAAAYATEFVRHLKSGGGAAEAISRAGLTGVVVPRDY